MIKASIDTWQCQCKKNGLTGQAQKILWAQPGKLRQYANATIHAKRQRFVNTSILDNTWFSRKTHSNYVIIKYKANRSHTKL